jgi:GTP cyclohydrolase I
MESAISSLLANLVINPRDENFKDTPERVARAFKEMILSSLEIETGLDEIFSKAFPTDYTGIIFVSDITSHSVCPHHLLPVEYNSTVAYIPGNELNKVIGLSKIIRLVQLLAKQAILQETYTQQISNAFMKSLSPVITSVMDGAFMDSPSTREEFFQLLAHSRG